MPLNIGLLSGFGDEFNVPGPDDKPSRFEAPDDPALDVILQSKTLSARTKSILREQKRRRDRVGRLEFQLNKVNDSLGDTGEGEGPVSFLGPVPVGFQFGTYIGIENPVARFAVDIIADPVNLISGVGSLTKLGRAARFLETAGKALTPVQKAEKIIDGAKFIAKTTVDEGFSKSVTEAVRFSDSKKVLSLFRQAGRSKFTKDQLAEIKKIDPDLVGLLKNRSKEVRGLRAAFDLKDRNAKVFKSTNFLKAIASGQRGLISLGIPFSTKDFGELTFPKLIESMKNFVDPADPQTLKAALGSVPETKSTLKVLKAQMVQGLDIKNSGDAQKIIGDVFKAVEEVVSSPFPSEVANIGQSIGVTLQSKVSAVNELANFAERSLPVILGDGEKWGEIITRAIEKEPAALKAMKNAPESAKRLMEEFVRHADAIGDISMDKRVITSMLEDYVPRMVEFDDEGLRPLFNQEIIKRTGVQVGKTARRGKLPKNRHSIARVFATMVDFERTMLDIAKTNPELARAARIKTKDITKIYPEWIRSMGTAIVRNDAIDLGMKTRVNGELMVLDRLNPVGKAQALQFRGVYDEVPHPAFKGLVFHKDVFKYFNSVFGKSAFDELRSSPTVVGKLFKALEGINAAVKNSLFSSLPVFHGTSLAMSNLALLPPGAAIRSVADMTKVITTNFLSGPDEGARVVTQMLSRGFDAAGGGVNGVDMVKRMGSSGLRLGRVSDAEGFSVIQRALGDISNALPPAIRSPIDGVKKVHELGDRALWSYMQNGFKANAWVHLRQAEILRNPKLLGDPDLLAKVEREVAQTVNASFGGLAWDQLLASKTARDAASFLAVAPDWTTSNLLMARDFFLNLPGVRNTALARRLTRDVLLRDVRFRWAMGYNIRAAFYGYMAGNLLNRAFTGRWLWENDDESRDADVFGLKTRIELPYKRADGRRQYMDVMKQFKEPLKMVSNPREYATGKMGVLPRVFRTVVVGTDGFGRPVYGADDGPYKQIVKTIFSTTGQFLPIPAQSAIQAFQGQRDARSAAISTIGFSIRSEDKEKFELRERARELRRKLLLESL